MSWIELHGQLFFHPKTMIAAHELTRGDAEKMVGHLARFWTWAIDHVEDGNLSHLNDRAIAEAAGWRRNPKRFVAALMDAGFLDADRSIHDWDTYAGKLLDRRRADRERKKRDYATKRKSVSPMDSPQESPPDIRTHLTRPYRTVPNQVDADANNGSGRVSVGDSSLSGSTRVLAGSRLSEKQILETTKCLLDNGEWSLDLMGTRAVLDILAKDDTLPDGDLNEALTYYNDFLADSPLEAKTVKSVVNAMRPWLKSYLRRECLRTLIESLGRDQASEILTQSDLGTDQYSEMSNTEVESAIGLLETFGNIKPARDYTADERPGQLRGAVG
jgi:hypothetical protein